MKKTTIDLSQPFEEVLVAVLSASESPNVAGAGAAQKGSGVTDSNRHNHAQVSHAELKEVMRCVYEVAHCWEVETQTGPIAIAPPVAAFLTERPFHIQTQVDFLLEVVTRIISGALHCHPAIPAAQTFGEWPVSKNGQHERGNSYPDSTARAIDRRTRPFS